MGIREQVVETAKTYIGTPYKTLDCNDFVNAVFTKHGAPLKGYSAATAKYLYDKGLTDDIAVSMKPADIAKLLLPGDVIIWKNDKYITRWRRVHHISIYIGGGKMIESTGDPGVHISSIWESSKWQIIMIGYPVKLIEQEDEEMIVDTNNREQAAQWQSALWFAGFPGDMKLDAFGSWGPKSIAATKAFQAAYGLPQTGEVDAATARAMWGVANNVALDKASDDYDAYIKRAQAYVAGVQAAANMKI